MDKLIMVNAKKDKHFPKWFKEYRKPGGGDQIAEKIISAWKLFYDSLKTVEVVIPFAGDIYEYVNQNGFLPISAKRAFKRVLSVVKTMALIHQKQRGRDEMGRVIAEYSDYALAYQLVDEFFWEPLCPLKHRGDHLVVKKTPRPLK